MSREISDEELDNVFAGLERRRLAAALSDRVLASLLVNKVWAYLDLHSFEAAIVDEAIQRLRGSAAREIRAARRADRAAARATYRREQEYFSRLAAMRRAGSQG